MKKIYYWKPCISSMRYIMALSLVWLLIGNVKAVNNSNVSIPTSKLQETVRIRGQVIDAQDKQTIPGVSITDDNKRVLGVTSTDGIFTLNVPKGAQLTFTFLGYNPSTRVITDANDNITIVMESANVALTEVTVTALGIKREEKSLGYSVSTVQGENLTSALSNNWMDALSGKVAGLNLVKSGGGPAGSTKIILRGETSLTGDNSALIVVDGVVISGSSGQLTGQGGGAYMSDDSPIDYGSSLSDINPEDIESVSVLKGPGASALYGSRGAGGAIIITTKQGSSIQQGLGVSFSSNSAFGSINRWPDYQNEYGQGAAEQDLYYSYGATEDGLSTLSTSSAWGPKFNGQMYYQYDPAFHRLAPPERTPWVAYPDNRKDFFDVSQTYTNSLTLNGGTRNTAVRLSYTNAQNKWIIPNTGYDRHSVALNVNHNLTDKLKITSKINYTNKGSDNLPSTGYNNQTIMYFMRGITPNMDLKNFLPYWVPGEEEILQNRPYSNLLDNPYLQAYEMLNASKRHGFIGTVQASYEFNKEWDFLIRTSLDFSSESRSQRRPKGTNKFVDGMYREQSIFAEEQNSDFLVNYKNERHDQIKFSVSAGGSTMTNRYRKDELRADRLLYPGVYSFANSKEVPVSLPYRADYGVNSLYALGTISYNDYLFMDVTGRNDWTSTLALPGNSKVKSFFYPSVNLSAVFSEMFTLPESVSFWKLRASVAQVGGGGTTPYLTAYNYTSVNSFPSGLWNPKEIPDPELKFQSTRSYELGTDIRLFKNRFGIDVTVYHSNSYDQILRSPIDPASGYSTFVLNAGDVQNRGLEIAANATILKSKEGLNWTTNAAFSTNDSKVISLADSLDNIVLSTVYGSRGSIEARPGGSFGDIYGLGYQRSPEGRIIYSENGYPLAGDSLKYLGNATPSIKLSWGNTFKYKQFSFNFLLDGQYGGKAYSLTHAVGMEEGKLKKTLPGRYNGIIGDGVIQNADGTFRENNVVATSIRDYYHAHFNRDNLEANMFYTDFIKLREARIDYTLPKELLSRLKLQKAVVGIYGRDLLVFSKWPAFDPEFGTLGNGDIEKGAEIVQFPSTRTLGVSLTVAF